MKNSYIILIFLIFSNLCFGQEDLFKTHQNQFDVSDTDHSYRHHISSENELKQVTSFLFIFYKEFISSQDVNSCVFTPSCSVYAVESIKKLGLLEGLANSFDRLTRCNPLSSKHYKTDPVTKKLYDPLEDN